MQKISFVNQPILETLAGHINTLPKTFRPDRYIADPLLLNRFFIGSFSIAHWKSLSELVMIPQLTFGQQLVWHLSWPQGIFSLNHIVVNRGHVTKIILHLSPNQSVTCQRSVSCMEHIAKVFMAFFTLWLFHLGENCNPPGFFTLWLFSRKRRQPNETKHISYV